MRKFYRPKSQSHDHDTKMYMEALSGKHADGYYKATYDEIHILVRRQIWEVVPRKSVAGHNVLTLTCSFK